MKDIFVGSLLLGALGDALGYSVEFSKLPEIIKKYGTNGITELQIDPTIKKAKISDDTQLTLFTAEGLILGHHFGCGTKAYLSSIHESSSRWLFTQHRKMSPTSHFNMRIFDIDETNYPLEKTLFSTRNPV